MRLSFFDLLCPSAFWVNPLDTFLKERCKPTHLMVAQRCGFRIPPTLISNDPVEILAFARSTDEKVVYKTFNALVPTSLLTEELLAEPELLRWSPGIYQRYIPKDHELRVTVIGTRVFAVRIDSQETRRGKVDWREAQWKPRGGSSDLSFEPAELPGPVQRACRRLVSTLGLAYGAIDLIVTPDQQYVFLEINPSGQFLWAEHEAGLPMLDALAEMLIQGQRSYRWDRRTPAVRFDCAFLEAAEARQRQSLAEHISDLRP